MKTRSLLAISIVGCVVFAFIGSIIVNLDTYGRRERVNRELGELKERLRKNPNDEDAINRLIAALDDRYPFRRSAAAGTIGQVGPAGKKAVPALARALKSNDPFVRNGAASSLWELGTNAQGAIPALVDTLKMGDCSTAWYAAQALGKMASEPDVVVPALVACLDRPVTKPSYGGFGPQLVFHATDALGKFGLKAKGTLPLLKIKLRNADDEFGLHLAVAIRSIDSEDVEALEVLISLIEKKEMRSRTLTVLGELGTNARPAIPAIEAHLRGELDGSDRQHAQYVLAKISGGKP